MTNCLIYVSRSSRKLRVPRLGHECRGIHPLRRRHFWDSTNSPELVNYDWSSIESSLVAEVKFRFRRDVGKLQAPNLRRECSRLERRSSRGSVGSWVGRSLSLLRYSQPKSNAVQMQD